MLKFVFLAISLSFSGAAVAGIYKCVDSQGKLSYQSKPCAGDKQTQAVIPDKKEKQAKPKVIRKEPKQTAMEKKLAEEKAKKEAAPKTYDKERFVGTWCWYEKIAFQHSEPANVTITFNQDGNYSWTEDGGNKQTGKWTLKENDILSLANIGAHTILTVTPDLLELQRHHVMKLRNGGC